MNNVQIQNVTNHKHLGLTLNQTCTWHDHISDISSKAWKRIHVFRSLMFKLDRKTLESIYFSFIRPTLEYADIVWDNCNTIEKYKLEQIQFEAAMIVTGATRSCSRTKLMEETGWLSLEKKTMQSQTIYFLQNVNDGRSVLLKGSYPTYCSSGQPTKP